jgi:hypothetical protein
VEGKRKSAASGCVGSAEMGKESGSEQPGDGMRVDRGTSDLVRVGMALIGADGAYAGLVVAVVAERNRVVHIEATRARRPGRWRVPVAAVLRVVDQAVWLAVDGDAEDGPPPLRGVGRAVPVPLRTLPPG